MLTSQLGKVLNVEQESVGDKDGGGDEPSKEDAIIKGRSLETGEEAAVEKSTERVVGDKDGGGDEPSKEDAIIKGRSLETGEEAAVEKSTERGSNDTEELVNVLTSLDAANILTSRGFQVVSVSPAAEVPTVSVPTGSGMVLTTSPIFTTASVVTPYSRRKRKEKMVESDTPKKKKLQEQNDIEDFVPMGSKEEGERFKRKGFRLEKEKAKKVKTSEEVSEEDLKTMMQLVPVEEVYVEALQLWTLVKETLSIRQATNDKEKELWVELKRLYEPDVED
nr:hypothetical protein [Tanacetum cinerariifolium]